MEIKIDLDLEALISSAVSAEKIQPILDKAISAAITDAVRDATGYRSQFSTALKQQLTEAMPHGLRISDIAKFTHVLNEAVSNAVHGENSVTIHAALKKAAAEVLPDLPSRIKLSELMEEARSGFHKEKHEAFYAHLEPSDYGGGWLYLDEREATKDRYRAEIAIAFTSDGEVYSLKLNGAQVTPKSKPNVVGRFEGLLLAMYVGRTTLEIDQDADEVEHAASEQTD